MNGTLADAAGGGGSPNAWEVWLYGLISVSVVSFCAVGGIALMPLMSKKFYRNSLTCLVGLGVGTLSGSAVFHLLPQAFGLGRYDVTHSYLKKAWMAVAGIYLFFFSDKLIKVVLHYKKHGWNSHHTTRVRKRRADASHAPPPDADEQPSAEHTGTAHWLHFSDERRRPARHRSPLHKAVAFARRAVGGQGHGHTHAHEKNADNPDCICPDVTCICVRDPDGREISRMPLTATADTTLAGTATAGDVRFGLSEETEEDSAEAAADTGVVQSEPVPVLDPNTLPRMRSTIELLDRNEPGFVPDTQVPPPDAADQPAADDCHHLRVPSASGDDSCSEAASDMTSAALHDQQAHAMCQHDHEVHWKQGQSVIATVAWMIIFGDGLHNFIDGVSIGASYSASLLSGFSVTVAVACEEFPHELGDVAILVAAGMSLRQALTYNVLSALTCYLGFVVGVLLGESEHMSEYVYALAGGMFLYISLASMIPEMNATMSRQLGRSSRKALTTFLLQAVGLFAGLMIMYLMTVYASAFDFS